MAGLLDYENETNPLNMMLVLGGLGMMGTQNPAQGFGQGAAQGLLNYQQGQDKRRELEMLREKMRMQAAEEERQNRLTDAQIEHYNALNTKVSKGADPYFSPVETSDGIFRFDARTGNYEPMMYGDKPLMRSTSDPKRQGEIANQKSGNTYAEFETPSGSKFRGTNYDYGASGKAPANSFDFNDPLKAIQDLRAEGQNELADQVEQQYAQQKYDAFKGGPAVGPSLKYKEDIQTQGAKDREINKANVDLDKATTQNSIDANRSANFQQEIIDRAYRYLYPEDETGNVSVKRDKNGRLIPPEKRMIYGASPADRIRSTMYDFSNINDSMGTNTKGLRRLTNEMVMAATGGKLGAGVSNADIEFLKAQQGVIDGAQNVNEIYDAFANIEDRIKQIKSRGGNVPTDPLLRIEQQNKPGGIDSLLNKYGIK